MKSSQTNAERDIIIIYKYIWIVNTKETKYGLSKWPTLAPEQMDTSWAANKLRLEIRRNFHIVGGMRFWNNFLSGINGTKTPKGILGGHSGYKGVCFFCRLPQAWTLTWSIPTVMSL